jgi:hypothetical protein
VRTGQGARVIKAGQWELSITADAAYAWSPETRERLEIFRNQRETPPDQPCESVETNKLISIVGPVVSYQEHYEDSCGAHPSAGSRFHSVRLAPGLPAAAVSDLFDERRVLLSLLQTKAISDIIGDRHPESLAELVETLVRRCRSDRDFLSAFAVLDAGSRVAVVRFGLGQCDTFRDVAAEFDAVVPITLHAEWFEAAARGGLLWMSETWAPPDRAVDIP